MPHCEHYNLSKGSQQQKTDYLVGLLSKTLVHCVQYCVCGLPAGDGECDDVESLDSAAQHQLLDAWQHLLGSAVQLVHYMQAAQWDGGMAMANNSNSCSSSSHEANAIKMCEQNRTAGLSDVAVSGADAAVAGSTTEAAAGSTKPQLTAVQQRLSDIDTALQSALDLNAAAPEAAAAALQKIEALALQMQAAGDNLPECCAGSSNDARGVRLSGGARSSKHSYPAHHIFTFLTRQFSVPLIQSW